MTQLNKDFLHTRVCELLEIDFPIVYTNAKDRVAHLELEDNSTDLSPLFDLIIENWKVHHL